MTKKIDRSDISLYPCFPVSAFKSEAEVLAIKTLSGEAPPLLESQITKGQRELWEDYRCKWGVIGHWLAYFRSRAADIRQLPYTLPEYKAGRSYTWVLNKRLDLFAGVFELKPKMAQHYSTPLNAWLLHVDELKQAENQAILSELPSPTKRDEIIRARQALRRLSAARVPFAKSPGNLHQYRLLVAATDLVRHPTTKERENFRRDYWKPYLNALEDWIEDLSGEHYVAVRVTERGLQERNKGRPRKELKK